MISTIYLLIGAGFQPSKVCLGGAGGGSVCVFACFDGVSKLFFSGQNMVMLGDNEQVPLGNMVKLHKVGCFFWCQHWAREVLGVFLIHPFQLVALKDVSHGSAVWKALLPSDSARKIVVSWMSKTIWSFDVLAGGFKYCLSSPLFGDDFRFD